MGIHRLPNGIVMGISVAQPSWLWGQRASRLLRKDQETTTDDTDFVGRLCQTPGNTDESNDEIRMSNDELMSKREMARGEQGVAVSFDVGLTTRHGPPKPQSK